MTVILYKIGYIRSLGYCASVNYFNSFKHFCKIIYGYFLFNFIYQINHNVTYLLQTTLKNHAGL